MFLKNAALNRHLTLCLISGRRISLILCLTLLLTASSYGASPVRLVKNFGVARGPYSGGQFIDDTLYFILQQPAYSFELQLWKSNGTDESTLRVLSVDTPTSNVRSPLAAIGGNVYFTAINNATYQLTLLRSDGISPQAIGVKELGIVSPRSNLWIVPACEYLFLAVGYNTPTQLWVSDGTVDGTIQPKTFSELGYVGTKGDLSRALLHDALFFTARGETAETTGLWKSDGTAAGTVLVKQLPFSICTPYCLTAMDSELYFCARLPSGNVGLWKSDGTENGTTSLMEVGPGGLEDYELTPLAAMNGVLYFTVTSGDTLWTWTWTLWKTDGSPGGAIPVKELVKNDNLAPFTPITVVGNRLYFFTTSLALFVTQGKAVAQLWTSDGTETGTQFLKSFDPVYGFPRISDLANVGGRFLFSAETPTGTGLWRSDGTEAGTEIVFDHDFTTVGRSDNSLYFSISGGSEGNKLYVYETIPPKVIFSAVPRAGDAPLEVQFTDQSAAGSSDITSWAWNFGDGRTSAEQNPVHTYTEEGAYTVTLTVTSADGTDSVTRQWYIDVGHTLPATTGTGCLALAGILALGGTVTCGRFFHTHARQP